MGAVILIRNESRLGYIVNDANKAIAFDRTIVQATIDNAFTVLESDRPSKTKYYFKFSSFTNYLRMAPKAYEDDKEGIEKIRSLSQEFFKYEEMILDAIFESNAYIFDIKKRYITLELLELLINLSVDFNDLLEVRVLPYKIKDSSNYENEDEDEDEDEDELCNEADFTFLLMPKKQGFLGRVLGNSGEHRLLGTIRFSEIKSISSSDGNTIKIENPKFDFILPLKKKWAS